MAIKWEDSYSVGITLIDDQHKVFFKLLDELTASFYEMKSGEVLERIFKELYDYANFHFDTEERYFVEFEYPDSAPHIEEHKNYIKKLADIQEKIKEDKTQAAVELIDFMEDWMVHHIDVLDKRYTKCFLDHGLK